MENKIYSYIQNFSKDEYLLNPFATSLKMSLYSLFSEDGLKQALEELSIYLCCYDIQIYDASYTPFCSIREPNWSLVELVKMHSKKYETTYLREILENNTNRQRKITIFQLQTFYTTYHIVFIDSDLISVEQTEEIILITKATLLQVFTNYERLNVLNTLATRDALTGTFNRLMYQSKMDYLNSSPKNITYVLADLFRLKKINDRYGHFAGDKYIKLAGQLLNSRFPNETYRIGGDEFCVICFDPTKDIDSIMSCINSELSAKMTDEFGDVDMYCLNYGYVTGSYQVADAYYRQADRNLGQDKSNFYKTHNIDRRQ